MQLDLKTSALNKLYDLFDETLTPFSHACQKGCDHCCTTHVTATTLEIWTVWQHLVRVSTPDKVRFTAIDPTFRPKITINDLATRCAKDEPVPEQAEPRASADRCPFLMDHDCSIYPIRPFACRMMVSAHNCGEFGYADINPLILTFANIFMQAIEHLDQGGLTGHMGDLLSHLDDKKIHHDYSSGRRLDATDTLLANHPLTTLMVPPEHRLQTMPMVQKINTVLANVFSNA